MRLQRERSDFKVRWEATGPVGLKRERKREGAKGDIHTQEGHISWK